PSLSCVSSSCVGHLSHLHSFPTRRSSDLARGGREDQASRPPALRDEPDGRIRDVHDPRPLGRLAGVHRGARLLALLRVVPAAVQDRKSTRLNSSHQISSYAVFCSKKKTAP